MTVQELLDAFFAASGKLREAQPGLLAGTLDPGDEIELVVDTPLGAIVARLLVPAPSPERAGE